MADQKHPQETASSTAVPTADHVGTAAAAEDQSRMCCAVGDLSCVVPVAATPQDVPGPRDERDAPKATGADEVLSTAGKRT